MIQNADALCPRKIPVSKGIRGQAPLGFEPRISCLRDRRFDQLSHGAWLPLRISFGHCPPTTAEGWYENGNICKENLGFTVFGQFWENHMLAKVHRLEPHEFRQRHRWDSNPGSPVYETGALTS